MKTSWYTYLQLSLAMIIVGSSVVVGKIITVTFPVFLATALSLIVAAAILIPLAYKFNFHQLTRKDYLVLFAQAFFGILLFRVFLLFGLRLTTSGYAGIITSTTPAIIGILAYVFLKENMRMAKIAGITLTVLGIIFMQTAAGLSGANIKYILLGNLLILGSAISEALFSVLAKYLSAAITPLVTAASVTVFGLILSLPVAIYQSVSFNFKAVPLLGWLSIIYYGVFVTVVAFFLWFSGLKKVDASIAGVFTGLIPISSIVLSYVFFHEPITLSYLIGAMFVILGIVLISKNQ